MKIQRIYITILTSMLLLVTGVHAQDTLRNHPPSTPLVLVKYDIEGEWGYIYGHNSLHRQQFAEKYYINGPNKVLGVITHHGGIITNTRNKAEYNVYTVGDNRLPKTKLGSKEVFYADIDLSGKAMITMFDTPIDVADSFFVSFNLFDYAHGGWEGDTVGLYCGEEGCRSEADIKANTGRNAIQRHNHSYEEWRDVYTQNFFPFATHFAIYPILQSTVTGITDKPVATEVRVYPNPVSDLITFSLKALPGTVQIDIINALGQRIANAYEGQVANDINITWPTHELKEGLYFYSIKSSAGITGGKFIVNH